MSAPSPWQLLHDLAPGVDRARRNQAAHALLALLRKLTGRLPAAYREEAVSALAIRFVKNAPLPMLTEVAHAPDRDRICEAYLRRAVENWRIDQHRKRRRDPVALSTGAEPADLDGQAPDRDAESDRAEAVEALGRDLSVVVEATIEARPARYREDLRRDWQHTWALVTESTTMADLERAEMRGPHDRIAARDRLYKRSQRLREALLLTADRLRDEGGLDGAAHARVVRAITQFLLRCQKPSSSRRLPS
jgi:hypothetical protein